MDWMSSVVLIVFLLAIFGGWDYISDMIDKLLDHHREIQKIKAKQARDNRRTAELKAQEAADLLRAKELEAGRHDGHGLPHVPDDKHN
jgi:ABC-type nickel/cobalt efflux system permease component RcnA